MTRTEKIQEAANHIDASPAADKDGYLYFARETDMYYRVSEDDLVELSDLMHDADEDIARDAYSHWCAGMTNEEFTAEQAQEAGLIEA